MSETPSHIRWRRALSPLRHPCSPKFCPKRKKKENNNSSTITRDRNLKQLFRWFLSDMLGDDNKLGDLLISYHSVFNACSYNREIKHHVYGKLERQKHHVIMSFPPFFTFVVFNVTRPILALVNNASISLTFLIRSAAIISLCLSPGMFYLFFYAKGPVNCQCLHKTEQKVRESEPMFGCHLRKGYQLFFLKRALKLYMQ